jgi:3-dehydroquinate synthase
LIYSRKLGCLDTVSAERALCLLEALGFDLFANELLHVDSQHSLIVLDGLEEFREHLGGELTVTLLNGIGQGFEVHEMNLPMMIEAIYELKERHERRPENQPHFGMNRGNSIPPFCGLPPTQA